MNILILPAWYPTEEQPIGGIFFKEQAEALARRGHSVTVAAIHNDGKKGVTCQVRKTGNLREYEFHHAKLPFRLTGVRVTAYLVRLLRTEFTDGKPDIIHVHSYRYLKFAVILHILFGVPIVVTEHATMFERGVLSDKTLRSIRRNYRFAEQIIAVGPGLKRCIAPLCRQEVRVIPNMVSGSFFARRRESIPPSPFRFVSVALLSRKKGMDVLLRAFAEVQKKRPDTHLTICGGGEEEEALRALARELGLTETVTFTGMVTREECGENLCRSHAFVLPSRFETFGIVYIEAMACGLPIIMTKTSAWELLARPETGLAVEIEDVNGLTDAMLSMAEHYERYDSDEIIRYCRSRFSEEAVCRELEAVYADVLTQGRERNDR